MYQVSEKSEGSSDFRVDLYGGPEVRYTLSRFEVVGDSTELSSIQLSSA